MVTDMAYARNGDCEIWFETFGSASNPTLVLVNGLGSQCINYKDEWCEKFANRGLQVVRLDNRDVGLSSKFEDRPVDEAGACYRLSDMVADVIAVLDEVGVDRAHVMGLSMGGMIVQAMAIEHPERLLTMTSVMSNTGEPGVGTGTPEAIAQLIAPPATDRQSYVKAWIDGLNVWGSQSLPTRTAGRPMPSVPSTVVSTRLAPDVNTWRSEHQVRGPISCLR